MQYGRSLFFCLDSRFPFLKLGSKKIRFPDERSAFYGCDNQTRTIGDKSKKFGKDLAMAKKSNIARINSHRCYCCHCCFAGYYDATSNVTPASYSCTVSTVMGTRASKDEQMAKIRRNNKLRAMNNVWFKSSQLQSFDF
jgi:hypothetical protein